MNKALSKMNFNDQTKSLGEARLLKTRNWVVNKISYPIVDVTFNQPDRIPLRVRLVCNEWDEKPPSIELLSEDGSFLTQSPKGHGVFHAGPHSLTGRPFICSPGSLEYHTHSSHITDYWENYKANTSYQIGGILTQIWYAWNKTVD